MTVPAIDKSSRCPGNRQARSPGSLPPWLFLSVFLWMAGCDLPGRPDPADRPVRADQVLEFSTLYQRNCAGCHGADGTLGPAPPLNDPLFRAIVPEAELTDILTKGRNKTLMPAFARENGGPLTEAQIQVLVREIKGIPYRVIANQEGVAEVVSDSGGMSPKWGLPGEPPSGVPDYREQSTAANDSSAAREIAGTSAFARACAVCHGQSGEGIAKGDALIHTIKDSVFLSLCSDQVLRRYVITGRRDLGMPGFADARPGDTHFQPLSDGEVDELVVLLASWRKIVKDE